MSALVTKTITAENTFSDPVTLNGWFNLSISGTFSATVTVQRRFGASDSWRDVDTFTAATEDQGMEPEIADYRVGVKTGAFTSGTIVVRVGQEGDFDGG